MVKDKILCQKVGEISLKGVSWPVETYRAVDSYMRRRSAVAGVPFWMFMASSGIDRGKITSTNTTAPSDRQRQSPPRSARLTATLATYREAI